VFLDGELIETNTPCNISVPSDRVHTIRVVKDGYQPSERQITAPGAFEINLLPVSPTASGTPTPVPKSVPSHHGGLFIHTYPEQAEVKIDGVVVSSSSPILISPLKEGFHTITAGILTTGDVYSSQQTIRTWVFPEVIIPVEFNLMDTPLSGSVTISSESHTGEKFTVNGYYPMKRIPEKVEITDIPSFITLVNDAAYYSFTIPANSLENGQFNIPEGKFPVCNLSIKSDPESAEIFIDGNRTGLRTPAVIPNVSEGYHRITVTSKERIPVTELIYVSESQCLKGDYPLKYSLAWFASGRLQLNSDPPGATVSIRGLKTGEVTPCNLDGIPIGVWEVMLTLDKSKKYLDVTVEPDQTRKYSVAFD
jgi:hypothetical protein